MTDITERRIDHQELQRMMIVCKRCGAELTIDLARSEQVQAMKAASSQLACAVCGDSYDSALPTAIGAFVVWHDQILRSGHTVFFRVA